MAVKAELQETIALSSD